MNYDYLLEPTRTGYSAMVTDFPPAAIVVTGSTREEIAMRMARSMKAAIEFLNSESISVPPPRPYKGEIPPDCELISAQHKTTHTPVGG